MKSQIERALVRRRAREQAIQALDGLRKDYEQSGPVAPKLETLVANRKDGIVEYHSTPFLNAVELLGLPEIGQARAHGKDLLQLAFEIDHKTHTLSPVLSSEEGCFLFRPVTAARPSSSRQAPRGLGLLSCTWPPPPAGSNRPKRRC